MWTWFAQGKSILLKLLGIAIREYSYYGAVASTERLARAVLPSLILGVPVSDIRPLQSVCFLGPETTVDQDCCQIPQQRWCNGEVQLAGCNGDLPFFDPSRPRVWARASREAGVSLCAGEVRVWPPHAEEVPVRILLGARRACSSDANAAAVSANTVSGTKPTPSSASSLSVTTRSASDRPQRSSRHTSTTSICAVVPIPSTSPEARAPRRRNRPLRSEPRSPSRALPHTPASRESAAAASSGYADACLAAISDGSDCPAII